MPGFPLPLAGPPGPSAPAALEPYKEPESPGDGVTAPGVTREPAIPLGLLAPGEKAVVADIRGGRRICGPGCCGLGALSRLEDLGLRLGKTLEVLNNHAGCPMLIKVDDARLALGRGVAMKILVRRVVS